MCFGILKYLCCRFLYTLNRQLQKRCYYIVTIPLRVPGKMPGSMDSKGPICMGVGRQRLGNHTKMDSGPDASHMDR